MFLCEGTRNISTLVWFLQEHLFFRDGHVHVVGAQAPQKEDVSPREGLKIKGLSSDGDEDKILFV